MTDKEIRDPEFLRRLEKAIQANNQIPQQRYGQLTWVRTKLHERFGLDISLETVRKWFAGEAIPRREKMSRLAELFEVDEAWLSMGRKPDLDPREQKIRNAQVDGVVNVVAGVIQIAGGHPAFPEEGTSKNVDLFAIIKGVQYSLKVCLAHDVSEQGRATFVLPTKMDRVLVIGVVLRSGHQFDFYEIEPEVIDKFGISKGGNCELAVQVDDLKRIPSFAERL